MKKDTNKAPRVSIIMPVYNCGEYLALAIDSVLQQTFVDWELVICDDGSYDDTYEIAQQYAKKCSKIILLKNEKNLKLNKTLNKCLDHARGEYIARMDGDDAMERERLRRQVDFLDKNLEYALCSTQADMFEVSPEDSKGRMRLPVGEVKPKDFVRHPAVFCHPAVLCRSVVLTELGGYKEDARYVRVEDIDLWVRIYEAGYKGYNLEDFLYHQRDDACGMARRTKQNYFNEWRVRRESFRKLNLPKHLYFWTFRPLVVSHLPKVVYKIGHNRRLRK